MIQHPQVLWALLLIVIVAILPILTWKKSRSMCLPVIGLYGVFIYLYIDFILGKVTVYHDTYWNIAVNFSLLRQRIIEGVSLGWNPYLGGGQPLSIFSNYFLYAPVFIFTKIFLWLGWNFSPAEFFSLIWIFNHLWICTGVYLFFHLWFNSSFLGFFGAGTMLLGGLFASDLAVPFFYTINSLPYLLFSMLLFWKFGRWFGLYLFAAFLGITVNYYNPLYIFSFLLVLLSCYLLINIFKIKFIFCKLVSFIKAKPYGLVLAALLFIVPAAPFLHTYLEMGEYISPTRGFTVRGQTVSNDGPQASTVAPLESVRILFDQNIQDMFLTTHTFYYIGILSWITLFISIPFFLFSPKFRARTGVFILSAILLTLMAMGHSSPIPLWKLLQNIPIFHIIRHTVGYAKIVTFLIIIIGLEGLRAIVYPTLFPLRSKIFDMVFKMVFKKRILYLRTWVLPRIAPSIAFWLLLAVQGLVLIQFSHDRVKILPRLPEISLDPFKYSSEWSLYGIKSSNNVFDLDPMVQKEVVWFNRDPNYVFMIHKDFIPFLRAATQQDLYEIGKHHPKDILLPKGSSSLNDVYKEIGFTKKFTYAPLYATVETNYPTSFFYYIYGAINGNFNSYWLVDKKVNIDPFTWLSITFPDKITVYGVRITPHKPEELWHGDLARMQISSDGKQWKNLLTLDLTKAGFDGRTTQPLLFPLEQPVTSKYFRLWIDDKRFASLSKIELIDEPLYLIKTVRNFPALASSEKRYVNKVMIQTSAHETPFSGNILFDANIDTYLKIYNPNDRYFSWLTIEFPASKTFNSMLIIPAKEEITLLFYLPMELHVSEDGKHWRLVKQFGKDGYKGGWYHFNQTITAKYVKLQLKGTLSTRLPAYYSIAELRFAELSEAKMDNRNGVGMVEPQSSTNPNRIYLKIHAEQDANLIRLENYDKGWKAYIDNHEVIMQKFGPNLQLISVPSGNHVVRLEFHSWYDILAWLHAWFAVFIWLLLAIYLCFGLGRDAQVDQKIEKIDY